MVAIVAFNCSFVYHPTNNHFEVCFCLFSLTIIKAKCLTYLHNCEVWRLQCTCKLEWSAVESCSGVLCSGDTYKQL